MLVKRKRLNVARLPKRARKRPRAVRTGAPAAAANVIAFRRPGQSCSSCIHFFEHEPDDGEPPLVNLLPWGPRTRERRDPTPGTAGECWQDDQNIADVRRDHWCRLYEKDDDDDLTR
jgi:hypothetical protein